MYPAALALSSSVPPTMNESAAERGFYLWCAASAGRAGGAMGNSLAGLAQLVEQLPCKHQVAGSTPAAGTIPPALLQTRDARP